MNFSSPASSRSLRSGVATLSILALAASCSSDDDDGGGPPPPAPQGTFNALLDEAQELPAPISGSRVRVTITNSAPDLGTFQTPVWVGFHDGTFDIYDTGAAADLFFPDNNALERIAEDGTVGPLVEAFTDSMAGSAQGVVLGQLGPAPGPIAPGETITATFEVDPTSASGRYFSYASMVIPSNDAFVANGNPMAHEIFDAGGNFVATGFTVAGGEVLDSGTEVNDEIPMNTAFFGQMAPDTGDDQMGLVELHPGFMDAGMGGILDNAMFANADFTAPSYNTLTFQFELLADDAAASGAGVVNLVENDTELSVQLMADGLSGEVIAAHLHEAPAGEIGPVIVDLGSLIVQNSGGTVVIEGSVGADADLASALRAGNVYFNVHTNLNPAGEIRGQLTLGESFSSGVSTLQEIPTPVLGTDVRVTMRNNAPDMGTFQTPVWVGFHDGQFDLYDQGAAANTFFPNTNALERIAEDGTIDPLNEAFDAMGFGVSQGVLRGTLFGPPPVQPGETVSMSFRLDQQAATSRYFSYASMVIPSNDAFIANGNPMAHEIFDAGGNFVATGFTVEGGEVLDAGTEDNDEIPMNTAFFGQMTPDTGDDQMGLVELHPGFMDAGMGGILDNAMFANADFTGPDYECLQVSFAELGTPEPGTGLVVLNVSEDSSELTYTISVTGLSGPATMMHFHEAPEGMTGPVVEDLADSIVRNGAGQVTAVGTIDVTPDFASALRAGNIYLNVHTTLNPAGEVRGQLRAAQ